MGSKPFTWDTADWAAIGKGAAIAVIGALMNYSSTVIADMDRSTAIGGFIAAGAAVVVNMLRKLIADNSETAK